MRSWLRRPELWLALLVVVVFGPFVQSMTAQGAARYALTGAIFDDHSVDITHYPIGIDKITLPNGEVRSDKAPGQPVLAIPAYAVARAIGSEPARDRRPDRNLGLWWITLWSTVLPVALLLVLMYRIARSLDAPAPVMGPIAIIFTTLLAAFASQLFGAMLAAVMGFSAWYVLRKADPHRVAPWIVGGLLVSGAIVTEYTMVLAGAVLGVYVLVKAPRRIGWFLVAGIPPAIAAAVYDYMAFGSPWKVGYSGKPDPSGFFGIALPKPDHLVRIILGDRGLLTITPIVLVAVALAVVLARSPGRGRTDAIIALVMFGLFLALQAGWPNPWGGDSPGPRYMTPAFPFLATPLALGWTRFGAAARIATAWGAICMTLCVVVDAVIPPGITIFTAWHDAIASHQFAPTLFSMALGPFGWILHVGLVVGVVVGLRRSLEHPRSSASVFETVSSLPAAPA